MIVRAERDEDRGAISALIEAAFLGHPHSDGAEPRIVEALRRADALSISLVAQDEGAILGHVALSPVALGEGIAHWYALGPLSVSPAFQRRGIGSALVEHALAALGQQCADGCLLIGDPAYYRRFRFRSARRLRVPEPLMPYLQVRVLSGAEPGGDVRFHPAFES